MIPPLEQNLTEPPPFRSSIDEIFLKKLSEGDRFLVTKMDEVSQRISWALLITINNHNRQNAIIKVLHELEARMQLVETRTPPEDTKLLKWVRENMVAPAKLIGWLIAAAVGATLAALAAKVIN